MQDRPGPQKKITTYLTCTYYMYTTKKRATILPRMPTSAILWRAVASEHGNCAIKKPSFFPSASPVTTTRCAGRCWVDFESGVVEVGGMIGIVCTDELFT